MRLIADRGQFRDPILERRIGGVDDAILDRLVQSLQLRFGLGDTLAEFGDMSASAIISLLPALKYLIHHRRQTLRIEQAPFEVIDHGLVQLVHRHGQATAARFALTRLG